MSQIKKEDFLKELYLNAEKKSKQKMRDEIKKSIISTFEETLETQMANLRDYEGHIVHESISQDYIEIAKELGFKVESGLGADERYVLSIPEENLQSGKEAIVLLKKFRCNLEFKRKLATQIIHEECAGIIYKIHNGDFEYIEEDQLGNIIISVKSSKNFENTYMLEVADEFLRQYGLSIIKDKATINDICFLLAEKLEN